MVVCRHLRLEKDYSRVLDPLSGRGQWNVLSIPEIAASGVNVIKAVLNHVRYTYTRKVTGLT